MFRQGGGRKNFVSVFVAIGVVVLWQTTTTTKQLLVEFVAPSVVGHWNSSSSSSSSSSNNSSIVGSSSTSRGASYQVTTDNNIMVGPIKLQQVAPASRLSRTHHTLATNNQNNHNSNHHHHHHHHHHQHHQNNHNHTAAKARNQTSQILLTIPQAHIKYPYCFSHELLDVDPSTTTTGRWYINLRATGAYVRSTAPPRYDHISCFVMKARYNCAVPPFNNTNNHNNSSNSTITKQEPVATDWKLILRRETNGPFCDLHELVNDIGGPVGVGRYLRREEATSPADQPNKKKLVFVLQGDSMLRQVWMALTCGWRQHITRIMVQEGGPQVCNHTNFCKARDPIPAEEMGTFLRTTDPEQVPWGCHDTQPNRMAHFFRPGVPLPTQIRGRCNTNVAMVEFAGVLQFHYIFHLEFYANPLRVYQELGLHHLSDITAYVGQGGSFPRTIEKFQSQLNRTMLAEHSTNFQISETIWNLQIRDIGKRYSADNPYTRDHQPDLHSCMPGAADDKANLLLFTLLRDVTVGAESGASMLLPV